MIDRTPKRILIFSTAYYPHIGGAEIAVKEITDRMPDISFDLLTVNLSGKALPEERVGNVMVYRVGKGGFGKFLFPLYGYRKALKLHREKRYEACWSIMASQASVAAAFFRMKAKVPLVLTLQEGDEEEHLARYVGGSTFLYKLLIRPWHRLVFKKADRVTVISSYLRARAIASGTDAPIDIVANGVDVEFFSSPTSPETIQEIRRKVDARQSETMLITVSRLVTKNAVDDVISALAKLPSRVKFMIVGTGPLEAALKKQVGESKLAERVLFVGHLSHTDLPRYLQAADIFVRPSRSEGFGNAFVEAMAAGIPVVATGVGGISDFLVDKKTGLVCSVNDPQSIADAVALLIEDPDLKIRIIENAKKMVIERYDWNIIARQMRDAFSRVAEQA